MLNTCGCIRDGTNEQTHERIYTMTKHNTTLLLRSRVKNVVKICKNFNKTFANNDKKRTCTYRKQYKNDVPSGGVQCDHYHLLECFRTSYKRAGLPLRGASATERVLWNFLCMLCNIWREGKAVFGKCSSNSSRSGRRNFETNMFRFGTASSIVVRSFATWSTFGCQRNVIAIFLFSEWLIYGIPQCPPSTTMEVFLFYMYCGTY